MARSMLVLIMLNALCAFGVLAGELEQQLWEAVKQGDAVAVQRLIDEGVDVDAPARYGATALSFASDRGHADVVRLLIESGADVNAKDTFYKAAAIQWAVMGGHGSTVRILLDHGASGGENMLRTAAENGTTEVVEAVLAAMEIQPEFLASCRDLAADRGHDEAVRSIEIALADTDIPALKVPQKVLQSYAGTYENDEGREYKVQLIDGRLRIGTPYLQPVRIRAVGERTFRFFDTSYRFEIKQDQVVGLTRIVASNETEYKRLVDREFTEEPAATAPGPDDFPDHGQDDQTVSSANWPQFRGTGARGIADGQDAPAVWNVQEKKGVLWKTPVDGLGNSCPVVWGDQVFLTTAISGAEETTLRTGLYGDVGAVDDDTKHTWKLLCVDIATGQVNWQRTALVAVPFNKRHPKSTHANPTPVTDGRHVVAFFGSEGLYCYDMQGQLLWKKIVGTLDSGWFYDEEYQWGFGSSPVLYHGSVIVQCDVQEGSFIAAYDLGNGNEIWRTKRDEIPTWNTPTVYEGPGGPLLITGGTRFARGYDPRNGEERWRLGGHSEISVPTPFVAGDLVFVSSGYRPIRPIYAIRLSASGDISLPDEQTSSDHVAWSSQTGGPYLPTPIVYRGRLYVCNNSGVLTCYNANTGEREYRRRLRGGGAASFTASPVAADGKLYFTSEQGIVLVVRVGPRFELLAANPLGEPCLATPAISRGRMLFRTQHHLIVVADE